MNFLIIKLFLLFLISVNRNNCELAACQFRGMIFNLNKLSTSGSFCFFKKNKTSKTWLS